MRVLCVDDDRLNALLFVESCRLAGGIEVETAGSGAEALECVDGFAPELLVIDLHLPDTDGFALLARLRARATAPHVPAVLFTGEDVQGIEARAREAGFEGCWTKPVDLHLLVQELKRRGSRAAGPAGTDGLPAGPA